MLHKYLLTINYFSTTFYMNTVFQIPLICLGSFTNGYLIYCYFANIVFVTLCNPIASVSMGIFE